MVLRAITGMSKLITTILAIGVIFAVPTYLFYVGAAVIFVEGPGSNTLSISDIPHYAVMDPPPASYWVDQMNVEYWLIASEMLTMLPAVFYLIGMYRIVMVTTAITFIITSLKTGFRIYQYVNCNNWPLCRPYVSIPGGAMVLHFHTMLVGPCLIMGGCVALGVLSTIAHILRPKPKIN